MKANVLFGIGDLKYTNIPLPRLKSDEVLVKVKAAGICGSDIARVFKTGTYHFPTVIGHEFSGVVSDIGSSTYLSWLGKRVSVFPLKPCFKCNNCKNKEYELCSNYDYLGSRCNGGFAEYVAVPVWNLLEIPDCVCYEEAAMLEPAAVALHALKRSGFKKGDTVVVIGPGTIGMILSQMVKLLGASKVVLVGRTQTKLDFAKTYGVENICNSTTSDVSEWVSRNIDSSGADIVFEGTGASMSFNTSLKIVKSSGTVVALGNPIDDMTLEKDFYWKLLRKQLQIYGTWNSSFGINDNDWTQVLYWLENEKLDLKRLITHRLDFSQLMEGLMLMRDNSIYSNKVMLVDHE